MAAPVVHFEIIGDDALALHKFYADVFGWKLGPPAAEMGNYSMVEQEPGGIAGGIGAGGDGGKRVTIYVEVDDPDAYVEKVKQAGGTIIMPVMQITEFTTIAMFTDPAGNITGLLKANPG